jgi:hypothetical protein
LATWQQRASDQNVFWPTNPLCDWIFEKIAARETNQFFAAGVSLSRTNATENSFAQLESQLPRDGVWLSGWELLGGTVLARSKKSLETAAADGRPDFAFALAGLPAVRGNFFEPRQFCC